MNMTGRVLALSLWLFVVLAPKAHGNGTPFWMDNGVAVCDTTSHQYNPQAIGDASGGAIIVWHDFRNGNYDIYAQRVDIDGNSLWSSNGVVICDTVGIQQYPQIVEDGSGGAVIVWIDRRNQATSGYDIYAQRIDAGGNPLWASNGVVICDATGDQEDPKPAFDDAGGAIIVWNDERNWSASIIDIYAQRIDAAGNPLWTTNGVVICDAGGYQLAPQIVSDDAGGAIITWQDDRSEYDIYAQRVDAAGSLQWASNGAIVCDATSYQDSPQITGDGAGGAIITWVDSRNGLLDIYAQRVDGSGNGLWTSNGIVVCDTLYEDVPQIVGDGAGGAIIAWDDGRDGNNDIYAQRVDTAGNVLWTSNGVVICDNVSSQRYLQLAGDESQGAIVTWCDERGSARDIYAQHVDDSGSVLWTSNGVAVCDTTGDQYYPQIVGDGAGGAIITWRDYRAGNYDIYAQKMLNPAPYMVTIADVPEDQGGEVAVLWDRSGLDHSLYQTITHYSIWRKYPWEPKSSLIVEEWPEGSPEKFAPGVYRRIMKVDPSGQEKAEYWEYMGSAEAHLFETYISVQPTFNDSSASGIPYCSFFVSAHAGEPFPYWDSDPDSGYSVDDIDPAKTQIGIMSSGSAKGSVNTVWLSWDQVTTGVDGSPELGPIDYRIYCGETSDFTPGPGNLLATTPQLNYPHTDPRIGDPAANLYYLVTTVDGSGNESAVSNWVGEFDQDLQAAK